MCVSNSLSTDPVRGATSTVLAPGCRFLASNETITTGLAAFSGGSVGSLTYQISPRDGASLQGSVLAGKLGRGKLTPRTIFGDFLGCEGIVVAGN